MENFEAQPTQPQTVTLTVTPQEFNVVVAALQEIPFKVADPVIRSLVKQVQSQVQPEAN